CVLARPTLKDIPMSFFRTPKTLSLRIAALAAIVVLGFSLSQVSAQAPAAAPIGGADILGAPGDGPGITNKSLLGIFHDGGWVMYPLLFCSFVLMVFTFERLISLRTGRVVPGPFVKRFMHQLQEGQ